VASIQGRGEGEVDLKHVRIIRVFYAKCPKGGHAKIKRRESGNARKEGVY